MPIFAPNRPGRRTGRLFALPLLSACSLAVVAAASVLPSAAIAQADDQALWHGAGTVAPVDATIEPVYGQPISDFSLIVWIDPECPYCKAFGRTPEAVVDASKGRVNLAVRLLPLPMHGRAAILASATAICVNQQASATGYYQCLDRYLELTGTTGAGLPAAAGSSMDALAREAGVRDMGALDACVHAPETIRQLGQGFDAANTAGVTGTPAIVVRDNRNGLVAMAEGAIEADEIERVIRLLVARTTN
jgi:protein-disulfide isomerase